MTQTPRDRRKGPNTGSTGRQQLDLPSLPHARNRFCLDRADLPGANGNMTTVLLKHSSLISVPRAVTTHSCRYSRFVWVTASWHDGGSEADLSCVHSATRTGKTCPCARIEKHAGINQGATVTQGYGIFTAQSRVPGPL